MENFVGIVVEQLRENDPEVSHSRSVFDIPRGASYSKWLAIPPREP